MPKIIKKCDELVCPVSTDAVKKYFVKKKECLDGLKTRKGGPFGGSPHYLH